MAAAERGAATEEQRLQPPSLFLMLAEARSLFELNSSLLLSPLLLRSLKRWKAMSQSADSSASRSLSSTRMPVASET